MANKVFVTGGSGFVGKRLLEKLCLENSVVSIIALTRSVPAINHPKIHWLMGDLRNLSEHAQIMQNCDTIYHVGALASFGAGQEVFSVNTTSMTSFVSLLSKSVGLKNFIFVSTVGAVDRSDKDLIDRPLTTESTPQPRSAYGKSKLEAEAILRASDLPWTIIRPTWVYGKGMRADSHLRVLASMAAKRKPATYLKFPGEVGLVHIEDLVDSLIRCLNSNFILKKIYFAQTEQISFARVFSDFHKLLGHRALMLPVPPIGFLLKRVHRFLPIQVTNLLLPYLTANGDSWKSDFKITNPKNFATCAVEVTAHEKNLKEGWTVITGANSGIGNALAKRWGDQKLILVDKDISNLKPSEKTLVVQADLSKPEDLHRAVGELSSRVIKTFVNNAGVGFKGDTHDLSLEKLRLMIDVNVFAPIAFVKLLSSQLIRTSATIINVGSSVGFFPLPGMSVYAASKSALVSWSEALAVELQATNKVITFCPSGTSTRFQATAGVKVEAKQGLKTPEQVAAEIDRCLAKKKSMTYVPGGKFKLLYFASHLLPRAAVAKIWGRLFKAQR